LEQQFIPKLIVILWWIIICFEKHNARCKYLFKMRCVAYLENMHFGNSYCNPFFQSLKLKYYINIVEASLPQ